MPRIYVKCKNCLNFKYIKGKKLMKVMILPNNSILEYVRFFYYLPLDIYCEIKNSNNQNYSIRINFYYQNNLIYHIFSNNDFSDYDFILDPSGHNLNWKLSDGCYYIDYLELEEYGKKELNSEHPYIKIGKFFYKQNNYIQNNFLSLFINPLITKYLLRHEKELQKDFIHYIQNNFEGSIIIYSTQTKCEKFQYLFDEKRLYGLTYIFPWSISLLNIDFDCFMTDATFKSMKPYILSILNIIISNESFPIGLSISPSETSSNYQRLWDHLISISLSLGINIETFKHHPFICDQGTGIKKFLIDNNIDIKYCHRHLIENFVSNSLIGNWVSRILRTNTKEEFEIISKIIKAEIDIYLQNVNINEQNSKAIEKFQKLNILLGFQKQNNDYNIEKWARWLRYGCPTTTNSIESIHHHINCNIPHKGTFISRLQNVKNVLFKKFDTREQWHGNNYNKYVKKIGKHPAINQTNVGNCNCGSYQFYSKLYKNKFTPCEHTIIDYINNYSDFVLPQIQEFTINHVVPNELKIININENIQDNWTKFNKEKRINECLNVIFKSNNLINMGNELYTIAWDIINSIKSILKKDEWKSKKHFIITFVLIGSNQINELNEIQIAAWRIQCYLYAGITNLN